jgi:hypothetical protein
VLQESREDKQAGLGMGAKDGDSSLSRETKQEKLDLPMELLIAADRSVALSVAQLKRN